MRSYTIKKVSGAPDWSGISALAIDNKYFDTPEDVNASAQLCYDDERLYVYLTAEEPSTRAVETDVLGMPCEDSCLEFFFQPLPEDSRYLNLEFNPNTSFYAGIGHCGKDLIRLLPDPALFRASSARTRDGWEISCRIPYSYIRMFFPSFNPHRGDIMYGNFFKCGDLTEKEHYLSWNPVTSERPDFHRPQDFGLLRFG